MRTAQKQKGFSLIESAVVILLISIVAAMAVPKISKGMRQYRLNMAVQRMRDLIQKGKAEAVAENRSASLVVDETNRQFGLIVYDSNANALRTDYVPLPDGVTFSYPASVTAPMTGAPTAKAISFPAQGTSTTVYQQNFTSRGFLAVATPGAINALYFGDGKDFRAITINSVGGTQTWVWKSDEWVDSRK
ncbi:MAG: prepilin-type N-terminal cleavage/methylation domain-containing protein [Acidobacteria bacterium]|nr:prepilin-type N-terminal cleavage/methylation domain-containing protein [Acidobacteriota bacterium]